MTDADAVVLPGTKHTLASLRWLRQRGFDAALARYAGHVVGICGGYQVLGERISDPHGVEGAGGDEVGLDLLPVTTVFADTKRTAQIEAQARVPWANDVALQGYEIHMGRTTTTNSAAHPVATITRRGDTPCDHADGTISADGRVWGCYIHGLFANTAFRHAWLRTLGWRASPNDISIDPYDQLADVVEAHLDAELLASLVRVTR
jgi:adenosylcobyric acid synthase